VAIVWEVVSGPRYNPAHRTINRQHRLNGRIARTVVMDESLSALVDRFRLEVLA
jgi:hypothetical protein